MDLIGFFFTSLYWWKKLLPLLEWVFSAVFQVLDWNFLILHSCGDVWKWIPKVILPLMDWFWSFSLEICFFCWLHICKDWNLHDCSSVFFLRRDQIFSMSSLKGNRFYLKKVNFGGPGLKIPRFVSVMFEWNKMSKKCAILLLFWQHQNFLISSLGFFLDSSLN